MRFLYPWLCLLFTATLSAQPPQVWLPGAPTQLPGPGNARLAEYRLSPPVDGVARTELSVEVSISGGEAYVYFHGTTPRNTYLSYRESTRLKLSGDTSAILTVEGIASADMDTLVFGVAHYGEGEAHIAPPEIKVTPVEEGTPRTEMAKYVNDFFGYVSDYALNRDRVDWEVFKRDAMTLSAGADSLPQVHEVLNFTLRRIDRHSFLRPPREQKGWATGNNDEDKVDPNLEYPRGRRVDKRMVYLWVPGISSGHPKTLSAYADSLQHLIATLDGPEIAEWIVDLRANTGGNCWPMLAGLGPLLGEGVCGYFMRRDGSEARAWSYYNGASYLDLKQLHKVDRAYRPRRGPRVAVLYGPKTASSAEVVAIAFRQRTNTKSFGQPTGGYSTGNQTIRLSDGAAVLLTVSVYGDRKMTAYGEKVAPEVVVKPVAGIDAASEAAAAWLRSGRK